MINHNILLYNTLDRTITVSAFNGTWNVNYTEGDLFELSKKLNDSTTKYPIIWLQTGYKVKLNEQTEVTELQNCRFFFITKGDLNDRYEKRFRSTYDEMLYPLLGKFKKVVRKSDGIKYSAEHSFTTFPFNDTAELNRKGDKPQKATINDIWDALVLETDLTIDECYYPNLKIN